MKPFFSIIPLFLTVLSLNCIAQPGIVTTIAGGGTSTAEGALALNASITPKYIDVDDAGNIYFSNGNTVKKLVAATNRIYTIAGNGITGYTGDGGPATAAAISIWDICADAVGNIYICDKDNDIIRKVTASTGIISTLSTPLADEPYGLFAGRDGNIYIANRTPTNEVVKYVPSTGLSSAIDMSSGVSAGLLTNVAVDLYGNVFVMVAGSGIWKRDVNTGLTSLHASMGGTVLAKMSNDNVGNFYQVNLGTNIRRVNRFGVVEQISSLSSTMIDDSYSGLHISQIHTSPNDICADRYGNIYYTAGTLIRKINGYVPGVISATGNFFACSVKRCYGPSIVIDKNATFPATSIVTDFGDGTSDVSSIPTLAPVAIEHVYSATATYIIKHKLYSGPSLVDSVAYTYDYNFCRTISGELFYDENSDCVRSLTEYAISIPVKIAMAVNGVPVDTITVVSGFSFDAYGTPGDVYSFRGIPTGDIHVICPASGIVSDTLALTPTTTRKSWAMQYGGGSSSGYDFAVYASMKAGRHLIQANILVNNLSSAIMPATLYINSSKYLDAYTNVVPSGYVDNTVYWDFAGFNALTATSPPKFISGYLNTSGGSYLPGDTTKSACSITPISGDATPVNNIVVRIDTVKSSFDPNYIEVNPSGCIGKAPTELTYTIGFENTGNDTAHNIYVLDTIPLSLDISTFQPLAASHEMHVYKYNLGSYSVIRFDFPNIMLPDSSHHNFCHGMFVYKIKTLATTLSRVKVHNRVGIYFDDNEVVMTNTAMNEIGCPVTGIEISPEKPLANNHLITLFPNPTTSELTIKTELNAFTSLTITNTIGQQVLQQAMPQPQVKVSVGSLPAGVYYVTLRGEQGSEVRKFVKW